MILNETASFSAYKKPRKTDLSALHEADTDKIR